MDTLTDRELQVLALVAAGEPTAVIGTRLGISENTVKSHLTRVYRKTGSRNRVEAARYYLEAYTVAAPAQSGAVLRRQQIRELQARIEQLAPAAGEIERLQHAIDALRAIEP